MLIYPALNEATQPPVVLLHGWGFDASSMAPLVEPLRQNAEVWCVNLPGFGDADALDTTDYESVLDYLQEQLPARACLVGWSVGGVLALTYAARFPERVTALATLAVNAKFVATNDWPEAMAVRVNRLFNQGFAADNQAGLKRFCAIVAQGSPDERGRTRALRRLCAEPDAEAADTWLAYLHMLAESDLRSCLADMALPVLHLLAERDALVPVSAAPAIQALNPAHRVEVIAEAGHALHWDQTQSVGERLSEFLGAQAAHQLDKHWIAKSFSRAAASYDSAARLQRSVGAQLLSQVPATPGVALDLGSGTGQFLKPLAEVAGAQVIALDIALGMLEYARAEGRPAQARLCADAQALPLSDGSVNLVFSSLAVQWCESLQALACELYRVIAPGGGLCLSTLTEGTLKELHQAWQSVDAFVHVNHFLPATTLVAALAHAGFVDITVTQSEEVLYCPSLRSLSRELKALGAHNVNTGRPKGLTGRKRLAALEAAYECLRQPEGLPATYNVCYLKASKPQ